MLTPKTEGGEVVFQVQQIDRLCLFHYFQGFARSVDAYRSSHRRIDEQTLNLDAKMSSLDVPPDEIHYGITCALSDGSRGLYFIRRSFDKSDFVRVHACV